MSREGNGAGEGPGAPGTAEGAGKEAQRGQEEAQEGPCGSAQLPATRVQRQALLPGNK